ncbi:MAG: ferrochelatase [Campylobacteraceae bacterium]|nr:ferrochelatase [Campylobacteraceae bacterium]
MKKKALVLMNMGGPRNKDELKMFLSNMFNDKNIISVENDFIRSIISKYIVRKRLNHAWENYAQIGGFSPINPLSNKLIKKLEKNIDDMYIAQVMRYTHPQAEETCRILNDNGVEEIVLLPLYAQYSTTTTKSSLEDFMNVKNFSFKTRIIEPFYKNDKFNEIIIGDIKKTINNYENYNLVFSAHGLPQKIIDAGDPYQKQIEEHVEILKEKLLKDNINFSSVSLAYQSKVGPMDWITPSLDDKLKDYENENVLIYPISFIIDNSETVYELEIEYKIIARSMGVNEYKVCSCVNDSDEFIEFIKDLIKE